MPVIIQRRILTDGAVNRVKKKKHHNYKTTASHHEFSLILETVFARISKTAKNDNFGQIVH